MYINVNPTSSHIYIYIYIYTEIYIQREIKLYRKTSLSRPTMIPSLSSPFREVIGLWTSNIVIMVLHEQSFGTEIKRSIQGNGRSVEVVAQRGLLYIYIYIHIYACANNYARISRGNGRRLRRPLPLRRIHHGGPAAGTSALHNAPRQVGRI